MFRNILLKITFLLLITINNANANVLLSQYKTASTLFDNSEFIEKTKLLDTKPNLIDLPRTETILHGKKVTYNEFSDLFWMSIGAASNIKYSNGYHYLDSCMLGACADRKALILQPKSGGDIVFVQTFSYEVFIFYSKKLDWGEQLFINQWIEDSFDLTLVSNATIKLKYIEYTDTTIDRLSYTPQEVLDDLKNNYIVSEYKGEEYYNHLYQQFPLTSKNVETYNNIAYYLEKNQMYDEAILILEKIIQKIPNRVVAYLNAGDVYWALNEKEKSKDAYKKYMDLMDSLGKKRKIPDKVYDRLNA